MKKILFMVSSMNIGGVEKSLLSLLSKIPKDKYDVTLLLLEKKGGFLEQIPDWVKVEEASWFKEIKFIIMDSPQEIIRKYLIKYKFMKILQFILSYFMSKYFDNRYIYYKNALKDVKINKVEYDVAIAYAGPTDIIDFYIANKVKAKKKISWVHFDISKHKINFKLYDKLYRKFDNVFAVSDQAHKQLINKIPTIKNKSEVFFNIVSSKLIQDMSNEKVDFDENYEGIKLLTVGRLSKEKGQDLAIKVLSRLKKDGYNVKWYCIGDGNARTEYENIIKENGVEKDFILLGSKTNPYPYINNCDIYVQTSKHEGYCLTLAEAKCLKKPIVTTNFIGAYEQIIDGRNGFIVDFNEDCLYEKLKYIIDNEDIKITFSNNLRCEEIDTSNEIYKLIRYCI